MGKAGFWLRGARGKFAGSTLYKGKTGTIQREIVEVSNPKTTGQMRQRALFAECVKFYKHAQQNFFKFAFEDKKQQESDYNAFVRHNVQNSIILPYDKVKNDRYPALGNSWVMTYGSLASPIVSMSEGSPYLNLTVEGVAVGDNIGDFFSKLIAAYGLQKGDFLTIVGIQSNVNTLSDNPNVTPNWSIKQYVIDPDATVKPDEFSFGTNKLGVNLDLDDSFACGGAVIFSRNIPGSGVKVSTSRLMNNDEAYELVNAANNEDNIAAALNTWGATGKAILQGSLVEKTTALVPEFVGFRGCGDSLIDAATYGLTEVDDQLASRYNPAAVNYVVIVGRNLEALDADKFSVESSDIAMELHRDAVHGYYLVFDIEDGVSGDVPVNYDGESIFIMSR